MGKMRNLLLLLFVICITTIPSFTQEYEEIGSGTAGTSYVPVYGFYDYSWSKFIYLQSELGGAKTLEKISFQLYTSPSNYTMPNQSIWIKHTSDNLCTATYTDPGANGFSKVYDGSITFNGSQGNWITIDFNVSDFDYNGSDNLMIIYENRDGDYNSGYPRWCYSDRAQRCAYKYADGSFPTSAGNISGYVPNVRFHYSGGQQAFLPGAIKGSSPLVSYPFSSDLEYEYLSSNLTDASLDFSDIETAEIAYDGTDTALLTSNLSPVPDENTFDNNSDYSLLPINTGINPPPPPPGDDIGYDSYFSMTLDIKDSVNIDSVIFEAAGQEGKNQRIFVRSSLDQFNSNLVTDTLNGLGNYEKIAFSPGSEFEKTTDITFRFYFRDEAPGSVFWKNLTVKYGSESGEVLCKGADPAAILSVSDATGGDGNITYKWQSSGDEDFSSPNDIPDSDTTSFDPPAGFTNTTWYRRLVKDGSEGAEFVPSDGIWKISVEKTPPVLTLKEVTVELDINGQAEITAGQLIASASDNCELGDTVISISSLSCEDLGETTVDVTLYDVSGNFTKKSAKVLVEDNIRPVLSLKDTSLSLDENGRASIDSEDLIEYASDNCGVSRSEIDKSSFDCKDIGRNEVLVTVVDNYDNWGSQKAFVTVVDDMPPLLELRNLTLELDETGSASLQAENLILSVSDNCKVSGTSLNIQNFNAAHLGNNEVLVTAVDESGNSTTEAAIVKIVDRINPSLEVQDIQVELNASSEVILSAGQLVTLAGDNCGVADTVLSKNTLNCSNLGNNEILVSLTDIAGNKLEKTVIVTVSDNQAPVFSPVEDLILTLDPDVCETEIDYPAIQVNDNCSTETELLSGLGVNGIFSQGMWVETWVARDLSGNTDTLSFTIIVSNLNANPEIDPVPDLSIKEDRGFISVRLTGISYGNDCLPQTLSIDLDNTNPDLINSLELVKISDSEYDLNMETVANMSGTSEISLTLRDNLNGLTTESFDVIVKAVNDPPVLRAPVPDYLILAGTELEIPLAPVVEQFFSDIDGDVLSLTLTQEGSNSLPEWATLSGDTLVCSPLLADTGCTDIIVTATDPSEASVSDTVTICIEGNTTDIRSSGVNQMDVELYPNPSNGFVNLNFNKIIHHVEIGVRDVSGRLLMQREYFDTGHISLNLEEKISGVLFIQINSEGHQIIKKLIVTR